MDIVETGLVYKCVTKPERQNSRFSLYLDTLYNL